MHLTRKKTKSIYIGVSILLAALIICSCAISINDVLSLDSDVAQAASVGAGTASVLNLNEKGVAQDYFSSVITGGQNEYIYLGDNVSSTTKNTPGYLNTMHTGAVKWRVLSTTDTKYNSNGGTWLLWSDYMLGCGFYNPHHKSPYYTFWGNSMIRAKLNGGLYQSTVTNTSKPNYNQEVNVENSWFYQIFKVQEERASFVTATDYVTWNFSYEGAAVDGLGSYLKTTGIVGSSGNKYNSTIIDNANSNGANASIINTSVNEISSGDYLFLIDFEDVNNYLDYGFGDNGLVYAKAVDPNWISSEASGYFSDGNTTVSYMKEPTDVTVDYFLRSVGLWDNKSAAALGVDVVDGQCTTPYTDDGNGNIGIRPAFNFSPKSVIYATAADMSAVGSTFADVSSVNGGKPAYKVYLKTTGYKNYSDGTHSDLPKLTTTGSSVSIAKQGQSGSVVFLLADPSGNGEVKYQATASFNNGVATATLPGGVKAGDYVVTALFLDGNARGGQYAEIVTASYTGLTVPEKKGDDTQYYNGGSLDFKLSYVDTDVLDFNLTYLGLNAATTLPSDVSTVATDGEYKLTAKEVGKYTLKVKPKSGKYWYDGTAAEKEYVFYIKHKVSEPVFVDSSTASVTKTYNGSEQSAAISNYDKDLMDIKASSVADLTFDATASPPLFKATKAKTYYVVVDLKDTTLMEWSTVGDTSSKSLTFVIEKKKIAKPTLANSAETSKAYISQTTPVAFLLTNLSGYTDGEVEIDAPTSPSGASVDSSSLKAINVGTYNFTVKLKDTDNTEWSDASGGSLPYSISVTVTRKDVPIPSFVSGADKKTYNGNNQTFALTIDSAIEIKNIHQNVVTALEEKNAGEYTYTLNLKDTQNTQWQGTNADVSPKNISFTIEKKTLDITSFVCSKSGSTPSWEKGESGVTFTVVEDSIVGDTVKLKLYIEQGGNKSYDFAAIDETVAKTVTVTIPDYLAQGSYIIGVELADAASDNANGNYVLTSVQSHIRKTFVIKGQGLSLTEENMPWIYKYTDKDGIENSIAILPQAGTTARKAQLTYTGYEYEFAVNVEELTALGAEIDTSKGDDNGFSGDIKHTNATTVSLTVTVYWKPAAGYDGNGGSYTLTYDIEKAKYDLTNMKWDYTNPKEYNPLLNQTVKLIDLPEGLTISDADYSNNRFKPAGEYEAKVVAIQNSNDNYYTPSLTDKDTYIYGGNEFPWTLKWKIVPKKLTLNWVEKNSDNNDFVYWVVSGDEEERIDSYLFYQDGDYDSATGVATGAPIALSDIVVKNKEVHAYWVVAILKDTNNYEIESNKAKRFTVGSLKEIVRVELKDAQPFVYNGKPYGQDLKVLCDDNTLTSAHIVTKYYKDNVSDANILTEAPKDAGKYILVMSLQDGLENDYELIIKKIEFEIVKAKITAVWDTSGQIPVLSNLDDTLKDIIGYIYYDAEGNQLEDGAQLEVGKTYSVKAILKGD
ncbi:MAG: hypothetical protein K2O35_03165, partial [Clostridia bacterium]|nr:hypothetical protein [Clostridia bacterium]